MQNLWTDEQLKQAFYLYCLLPFGKMHSKEATIIDLAYRIKRTPSAVAMKLVNFASLDPAITSTGRKGLSGASASDRKIWLQFHNDWTGLVEQSGAIQLSNFEESSPTEVNDDTKKDEQLVHPANGGTNVLRVTKTRVGQNFFRQSVLANFKGRCCITGLDIPALLVASHIKPWASDNVNRLNPSNGLCLSSLHDKAFDQGLISLSDDHCILVSSSMNINSNPFIVKSLLQFAGKKIQLPEKFIPAPAFIAFHRETIFRP